MSDVLTGARGQEVSVDTIIGSMAAGESITFDIADYTGPSMSEQLALPEPDQAVSTSMTVTIIATSMKKEPHCG